MRESSRLKSLDSARGIAATLVLVYHIKLVLSNDGLTNDGIWNLPLLRIFFELGEVSVFFFMLLSGYVLAQVIHYSNSTKIRLLCWRIFRLSSIYYLSLIIAFALSNFSQEMQYQIRGSDLIHTYLLSNYTVFSGVNPPLWSLSVEILFSILFFSLPKSYFLTKKLRQGILAVMCLIFCYVPEQWGLISLFRCFAFFLLGVIIFNSREYVERIKLNGRVLISILAAQLFLLDFSRSWGYFFLPLTLPLLMIYLISTKNRFLNSDFAANLGSLSFSLYVIHWPVLSVLARFEKFESSNENLRFAFLVLICFMTAKFFHIFIDKPISMTSKKILISTGRA